MMLPAADASMPVAGVTCAHTLPSSPLGCTHTRAAPPAPTLIGTASLASAICGQNEM